MLQRTPIAAIAAILALAACDSKPSNTAETPAIKSSKQYRCTDDSVVTVNLFEGDLAANVREDGAPMLMLKAEEPGTPMVAEGAELEVKGDTVSLTRPGKPKQNCTS